MSTKVYAIGRAGTPVICIDSAFDDPDALVEEACKRAPFHAETTTKYPGLRYRFQDSDLNLNAHIKALNEALSPLIQRVYRARLTSISAAFFSMVTSRPDILSLQQSVPHYDSIKPSQLALLHYLSNGTSGGTAFYRHRSTGIEVIDADSLRTYKSGLAKDLIRFGEPSGYISGSTDIFEEIAKFDAVYNRILIYPSAQLHSGLIAPDFDFNPDPRLGRLTFNAFIRLA